MLNKSGPKSDMIGIFMRIEETQKGEETQRGKGHVRLEPESGVRQLSANE